jgi:hypothetical protein
MTIRAVLIAVLMLAPTFSQADVMKCKIDGYSEAVFITTPPDTRMGATAFENPCRSAFGHAHL